MELKIKVDNFYSCQRCQKIIELEHEIKIIPSRFPLCFKCKSEIIVLKDFLNIQIGELGGFIFDSETYEIFKSSFFCGTFEIIVENGYLARKNKNKVEFFHRFLMDDELWIIGKINHVHHINGDKKDNRRKNLQIISKEEHFAQHDKERYDKAYQTWMDKVHLFDDGDYHEEFDAWFQNKKEEEFDV